MKDTFYISHNAYWLCAGYGSPAKRFGDGNCDKLGRIVVPPCGELKFNDKTNLPNRGCVFVEVCLFLLSTRIK
uniref:Uncharacterized protein n=1 Tax=Trichuris muris TaxID=70415 RepID=A0A5S6Q659_TRIMR